MRRPVCQDFLLKLFTFYLAFHMTFLLKCRYNYVMNSISSYYIQFLTEETAYAPDRNRRLSLFSSKEYLGKPRSKIFSFINAHTYSRPRCFSSSPGRKLPAAGSGEKHREHTLLQHFLPGSRTDIRRSFAAFRPGRI